MTSVKRAACSIMVQVSPTVPEQDVWVRTIVGWHIAFWAMLAIVAIAVVADSELSGQRRLVAVGLLAVLAAAYAVLGTPASRSRDAARAHGYLLVLVLVVPGVIAIVPHASFLLFLAYPQIWFLCDKSRDGVVGTITLTVGVAIAYVVAFGSSSDDLRSIALSMGASLLFSLLLGLWIARVIDQSRGRAELIEELEATRSELAEAHHAQGVMAERERFAREIHDTLAQGFTSVVMLAQAAQAQLSRDSAAVPGQLAAIERTARENLAEARAVVAAFSPVALDGTDLAGALRRLADRFSHETGIEVDLGLDADVAPNQLDRDREVVLLRAAQEALANVRRHSDARRVTIRLRLDNGAAEVEVSDDGHGFDPETVHGLGLAGMRGRVEDIGGEMDVVTGPGRGTHVRVSVPSAPVGSPRVSS